MGYNCISICNDVCICQDGTISDDGWPYKNPQQDFPGYPYWSILVVAYVLGTVCNIMFPAQDANIIAGVMQAMKAALTALNITWLLPLLGILIGIGALAQVNAWLVGPIYMLNVASAETGNILGKKLSERHPKYGTPSFALYAQAVIVTVLCFMTFVSPSLEALTGHFPKY